MSEDQSVTGDGFRIMASASTGVAIGALLAGLAMLERSSSGGLGFRFNWLAPLLMVAGFTAGSQFWRFMFLASELDPAVSRRRLKQWGALCSGHVHLENHSVSRTERTRIARLARPRCQSACDKIHQRRRG